MNRIKVAHLVLGLGKSGAETMLYQIIKYRTSMAPEYKVISLGLSHYYEKKIREQGVKVVEITDTNRLRRIKKTITIIRSEVRDADIICSWLYIANALAFFLRRPNQRIIWCVRHSDISFRNNSLKTFFLSRACSLLSKGVHVIAYNGNRARQIHESIGYKPKMSVVLDNGVEIDEYTNNTEKGKSIKRQLEIDDRLKVILSVARNNKIKDLPTFVKMFSLVHKMDKKTVAIMCGSGIDKDNGELVDLCSQLGLNIDRDIFLLGFCEDVSALMNTADVYVLHSRGEAFPNTLIQAMSCGKPVVSTDVGDVRAIIGDERFVVEVGDYNQLAQRVYNVINMDKEEIDVLSKTNRDRIVQNYNIKMIVKEYEKVFHYEAEYNNPTR